MVEAGTFTWCAFCARGANDNRDEGIREVLPLGVAKIQIRRLVPPKATGEQNRQQCAVPFAFNS
jgi:hypothetical protein